MVQSVELAPGVKKVVRREKPLAEIKKETPRPTNIKTLRGEQFYAEEEKKPTHTVGGSSASSGRQRKPKWR